MSMVTRLARFVAVFGISATFVGGAGMLAGCAHGEDPEAEEVAGQSVHAADAGFGDKGSRCGGSVGLKCNEGLECRTPTGLASGSTYGTCQERPADGAIGGRCGGPDKIACVDDGYCKVDTNSTEKYGTCTIHSSTPSEGEQGSICGGIAGIQCKRGLTCKNGSGQATLGDQAGTCM